MRFDNLSQPVSEDQPAGPDLDEEMDTDYLNYTLVAPDRLPTSYLDKDRKPYDKSQISLDTELETIAGFLERSRDVRLLTLDARFNAAAGSLTGFFEATEGLATVVSTFWDKFHPNPADGDMMIRQNTVESLDDLGQIVMHLQNAPLAGGGRTRPVSLRHYLVATGKAEARAEEDLAPLDAISQTLTNEANTARVTEIFGAIKASSAALDTVRNVFVEKAGAEFSPSFEKLQAMYQQMLEMIGTYRTDLAPPKPKTEAENYEDSGAAGGQSTITGSVKSHADATAALTAAEGYFLRFEPSSPAMILVHQARMLIGRPLTEALEALLPEPSSRAVLRFDAGFRFDIDLTRMKFVTDDALANGVPTADEPESSGYDYQSGWADTPAAETPAEETASNGGGSWGSWGSSEETPAEGDGAPPADSEAAAESTETPPEPAPEPEPEPVAPAPPPPPSGPQTFSARTRANAAELINATEAFFRQAEPSSAIPVLLAKARTYINKDFASILSEIIPREETGS